jgi:hypothetical protein
MPRKVRLSTEHRNTRIYISTYLDCNKSKYVKRDNQYILQNVKVCNSITSIKLLCFGPTQLGSIDRTPPCLRRDQLGRILFPVFEKTFCQS